MASGKSHVGQLLAKKIGWSQVDADDLIVARAGKSIEAIFQEEGEPAFRKLEAEILAELCQGSQQVISTGGGAFVDPTNRTSLLEHGLVICLIAQPETIYRRLSRSKGGAVRPLLQTEEPMERIKELLDSRAQAYRQAHHSVETDHMTPQEVAEKIFKLLQSEAVAISDSNSQP